MAELSLFERLAQELSDARARDDQDTVQSLLRLIEENGEDMEHDWRLHGRPSQFAPEGPWTIWAVIAGRGFGKALESTTPIPTPDGFTEIRSLRAGDVVYDQSGSETRVLGVFPQGQRECVEVTFDDGTSLVADLEHLWTIIPGGKPLSRYTHDVDVRDRRADWWSTKHAATVTSSQLTVGDTVPVFSGLQSDEDVDLPIDPYTLGAWLGDGSSGDCSVCGVDDYIFERIGQAYELTELKRDPRQPSLRAARFGYVSPTRNRNGVYGMSSNGMNKTLRDVDVYKNKHIPTEYFRASKSQRLALLQGIMDTDGTISKNGLTAGVGFVNKQLRDDTAHLVRTLGIKPYTHQVLKGVAGRPETRRPFYTVDWRATEDIVPFGLPRKASRVVPLPRPQATRKLHRRIVSIEPVGLRDATCIKVEAESSLFLAGEGYITTHNTRTGAEWIREKALQNPGCRIALVGRTSKDVGHTMIKGESGILAVHAPDEKPRHWESKGLLEWPNGSIAEFFSSEAPSQIRGPQFHFAWGDETASWKHTQDDSGLNAWDNLRFATRLGSQPQILVTTTPKRTQAIIDLFEEHEKKPEKVVLTRGTTYDNISNLPESFLDDVTGQYEGTNIAEQELLGLLLGPDDNALWDQQIIEDTRWLSESPWRRLPVRCVALDPSVADQPRDEAGIVVVGATGARELHKRHAYVLEDASLRGSPDVWAKKAVEMAKKYSCPIVAEGTQGQALVSNMIRSIDPSIKVFLVQTGRNGKIARAEPVVLPYQQKRVHHVGYFETLELQLTTYSAEGSKKSPDRMDALVHGLTALLIKPPKGFGSGGLAISKTKNRRIAGGGRGSGRTWRDGMNK